jgi:iron complex outermembrane receptor protein
VKTFKTAYCTQPATRRSLFAVSSTATGCAVLLLAAAGAAAAADQPAPAAAAAGDIEEIIVTGIRAAIESAISVKKKSDTIVESISAEDIGKLPDTSIAESLARLPGVTTQRDRDGNATNVSIRGLGPDFNGYLLNGREQTSTGDSRAVDLSVYPAELIGGATVYKTGDAALMTAGLAGTIDNHLVDPLAYGHMIIAANAERTKNGVGIKTSAGLAIPEGKGNRYSLSYIDQFADRRLGIALGFVHSESDSNSLDRAGSWGNAPPVFDTTGTQVANGTLPDPLPLGTVLPHIDVPFAGGLSFESDKKTDKRDGGALILNFKPNDSYSSELDYYYAKIKTATKKQFVKRASNGGNITNATVVGGVVESGTFTMSPYSLIDYNENLFQNDTIQSAGWKNSLEFSDTWSVSLDLSHNKAERIERDIEAYAGIATGDTLSFTNGGSLETVQFSVGSPLSYTDANVINVHDVSGWSGVNYPVGSPYAGQTVPQAGYNKGPTVTDKLDAVRLDFKHDLGKAGMFRDLDFGLNHTKRTKERITDEGLVVSANNGGYDTIPFPANSYVESSIGGTGLNLLAFDPQVGLWPGAVILRKFNDDILSKTWTVEEKVTTAYARLNIDTQYGNIPVRGNVGLQVVNTDQSSAGFRANVNSSVTLTNPAGALTSDGVKYTDVLPSLNLTGDFGNGKLLRFAAGIQIARPNLTDMRNSLAASTDSNASDCGRIVGGVCIGPYNTIVGSAGNPHLKPFKAETYDLSFEKYFQNKAYFSVAVFLKQLYSYVTPATNYGGYDFSTIAPQLGLPIPGPTGPASLPLPLPPTNGGPVGSFTQTINGSGGNIKGFELAASLPFSLLTDWLEGFGITGSYSSTYSSVELPNLIGLNPSQQVPADLAKIPLPGLSHINDKAVLYYERAGFSVFYAYNHRSEYIANVANNQVGGYPALIYIEPQTWISAQAGYEFQSGPLKGLGLRLEGNNLNKPTYKELKGDHLTSNANKPTGASYALKLFYKFQ